ncbi:M1 family metallopeptidase [Sphingomonas sp. BIUV-7]|uniref:Aminopeptidase n=1 Tax=Sphingomonas natans TaxID=3063330 RepID=A0ABT8YA89_9SPHN|nr:M1 family metallopeptidase [Sphingomonas sp. BIUV-7]MDO6414748.1 M1 family metallopeptidase [Sphingomonas sp. BIUV-7]
MRATLLAALAFASPLAIATAAHAAETGIVADASAPKGKLPDQARPIAYRLDLTILPDQPRFSGHAEIDVTVKAETKSLYLHGRDLTMAGARAIVGGKTIPAKWAQVDKTGTARLDFAAPLPAGRATLAFDYDAAIGDSPSSLYRVKVGTDWYSWTQFESIDARGTFPSFDEPGFKTPFTVSITTKAGDKAVSNAPETDVTRIKVDPRSAAAQYARAHKLPVPTALDVHHFQPTLPLPTYLVALMAGPYITAEGNAPPVGARTAPLPLRIVATKAQAGKLDYAIAESPRIVELLEKYFGQPFPFPKLDQIGSPVMPGAMENAGADIYGDDIILIDGNATTRRKQNFGMIVAHELSHQWFGDLVTPAWWDDIWLNESFANWMGYRIGNEWRPELNIGVGAIDEALSAMDTDALEVGRPIHQIIAENSQIDSAFDSITYGKGGQVVAMIASYLGDEEFRDGVRLHLSRHRYGNATSDEFFQALADAAHDPRVLPALKSFVDQQGVPVVDIRREGGQLVASQSRYAFLGSSPKPLTWTIPLCVRVGEKRTCSLLDKTSMAIGAAGPGAIMPNAGGAGYYRFTLSPDDWKTLIAAGPTLPAGEALAADDSLWAAFRAGKADAATLITAAKTMATAKDSNVAVDGGLRLAGLRATGLIDDASLPDYRRLISTIYGPMLAQIGFDPAAGAHKSDDPDRQKLRQDLVRMLALTAQDADVRAKLLAASDAYFAGNMQAIDQAFLAPMLALTVQKGGLPAAKTMLERALTSEDAVFRPRALNAIALSGDPAIARWVFGLADKRLRPTERINLITLLATTRETRDVTAEWLLANYDTIAAGNGIFITSRLPQVLGTQCSAERAADIQAKLGPKVKAMGAGELEFARTVEEIRHCGVLKDAKADEIAAALKAAVAG